MVIHVRLGGAHAFDRPLPETLEPGVSGPARAPGETRLPAVLSLTPPSQFISAHAEQFNRLQEMHFPASNGTAGLHHPPHSRYQPLLATLFAIRFWRVHCLRVPRSRRPDGWSRRELL